MNGKTKKNVHAKAEIKTDPPPAEDAIYPPEFLDAFTDTAFQAIQDYLERTEAPREVRALIEELAILTSWAGEVKHAAKVNGHANQFLIEMVASASRNIAEIGGVFYCPSGTTCRRPGAARAAVLDAR